MAQWLPSFRERMIDRLPELRKAADMIAPVMQKEHGPQPRKSSFPLRDTLKVLFRHKWKMVTVFCITFAVLVCAVIVFPRSYTSEARLFIRLGRESVSLDPTATLNEVINVNDSRESEINSELEILRSRAILEDTVDEVGANVILSQGQEKSWLGHALAPLRSLSSWLSGDISSSERAVHKLEKSIRITSPTKSNILLVRCKANDPQKAQQILEAFLDSYFVLHTDANRTSGSHAFFTTQSEVLRAQLTQAESDLREAKNQGGMASIEGQRENLEDQANFVAIATLKNERDRYASEAKVKALKGILNSLPEHELAEESIIPSRAVDEMRNELYKLQMLEKAVSAENTDAHPGLTALRRQLEETRRILASEEASRKRPTRKVNVVHQAVQTELAEAQADAAAHDTESKLLEQQFGLVQSKIKDLNDTELKIHQLSRRVDLLAESYALCSTSREKARVDAAMEEEQISNVNVVQAPSFVEKPSSPKSLLALALALVLSTGAAALVAILSEHFDRSLKSPDQVERELGLPVLFAVPRNLRNELAKL